MANNPAIAQRVVSYRRPNPSPNPNPNQVRAMALVAERPELRDRLAAVSGLPEGLRAAAASRDAASAEAAADLLAALKLKS